MRHEILYPLLVMKLIHGFLLLILASLLLGCGGSGGGSSDNPLFEVYRALLRDVEDEDLSDVMSHYSFDYFHDCDDYDDVENSWDNLFSESGVNYDIQDLDFTYSEYDSDFGYIEGSFVLVTDDNGDITEEEFFFGMYFSREDGEWYLYGDQECEFAPGDRPAISIKDLLGSKK